MQASSSFSFYGVILFFLLLVSKQDCSKEKIEDCYSDRTTTEILEMTEGHIEQHGKTWIIISKTDPVVHYAPCNLPEAFKEVNRAIRFGGLKKEIYAHERWAGHPFVIVSIESLN